jgi:hypothetical protein
MTDRQACKVFLARWEDWVELCREYGEDPREAEEINFGLSGGNYYTVRLICDPPKEEDDER